MPSVHPELSNNSPELDNKNGESISRQAAIDLVKSFYKIDKSVLKIMVFKLKQLPSVQPETNCSEIPNNSDLISRQAAIDAISKKQDGVFNQDAEIDTAVIYVYSECKAIIKYLPSILPEGIRCKDCKHWMMGKTTKNYPNPYICELHSFMHGFERSALPEDYCSWAELRGDAE